MYSCVGIRLASGKEQSSFRRIGHLPAVEGQTIVFFVMLCVAVKAGGWLDGLMLRSGIRKFRLFFIV